MAGSHPYTLRLARPEEEDEAFAVERAVWAPFNWLAEEDLPDINYDRDMHIVAVDNGGRVVANIDAYGMDWDGDPGTLPPGGWADTLRAAAAGFASQPAWACAHGASILPEARGGGLAQDLLVTLRDRALELGYAGLVAPVRPSARARMPHLTIAEYAQVRLPDGRHFDPWVRAHETVGGRIVGSTAHSMRWYGSREQWEAWTKMRLPDDGLVLVEGSTGWLELVHGSGELIEDSIWLLHSPKPTPGADDAHNPLSAP